MSDSLEPARDSDAEELQRLRERVAQLERERSTIAGANVRAALQMAEINEQRRRESEEREHLLERALHAAEAAAREKGDFLAKVSHELRTPLNGIIGMINLMLDGELVATQREYAAVAHGSAQALLELINDILDFSKMEAGALELAQQDFDLWRLVGDVLRLLAPKAAERELEFGAVIAPDAPRWVVGDPMRVRQILLNLCGNALKFTDRGEVSVHVRGVHSAYGEPRVQIDVTDTGCGIAPDALPRLFRSFSQVDDSLTRRHGGTGLGLAICKKIVERMGGTITVDSELGVGSRFTIDVSIRVRAKPCEPAPRARSVALCSPRSMLGRVAAPHLVALGLEVRAWAEIDALRASLDAGETAPDRVVVELFSGTRDEAARAHALEVAVALSSRTRVAVLVPMAQAKLLQAPPAVAVLFQPIDVTELIAWLREEPTATQQVGALARVRPALGRARPDRSLRALLVEDNRVNQLVAQRTLDKLGCSVDVADDGLQALERLAAAAYDIVFMDCQMPHLDGFETTRKLRELESAAGEAHPTPVIALTAQAMTGDRDRCLAAGMNDYLAKPIDVDELAAVLLRWCSK